MRVGSEDPYKPAFAPFTFMTRLTKAVHRVTGVRYQKLEVIVTIAPAGGQAEALLGFRLKGRRTQYVVAVSDIYRIAALWHGSKEKAAKAKARKDGVPWARAKREFARSNSFS